MPPDIMVGAFLKYGKLAAAQPCPPYKCGPPAGSFAKKFEITDRVWNDILYDLDAQETIKTINEIENEVLIFGANMTIFCCFNFTLFFFS